MQYAFLYFPRRPDFLVSSRVKDNDYFSHFAVPYCSSHAHIGNEKKTKQEVRRNSQLLELRMNQVKC